MPLVRFDGNVLDAVPRIVPGALIAVLTQPANTTTQPGTPLASIYKDSAGAIPLANPFSCDANGNYFFYAAAGLYTVQVYGGSLANQLVYPDQNLVLSSASSISLKTNGTLNSSQILLNLKEGSGVTVAEVAGAVTISATAAQIVFKTNGSTNSVQDLMNLVQGTGITLSESAGSITISNSGTITIKVNGTSAGSQSLLNLVAGSNVTITDGGSGNITIDAAEPVVQVNSSLVSARYNFEDSGDILIIATPDSLGTIFQFSLNGTFPRVVYSLDRTNQVSGDGSPVTMYTPIADGVYRIEHYAVIKVAEASKILTTDFSWTDEVQAQFVNDLLSFDPSLGGVGAVENTSHTILAKAGQPIKFQSTTTSTGTGEWNLSIRITQLS